MIKKNLTVYLNFFFYFLICSCSTMRNSMVSEHPVNSLNYLGSYTVSHNFLYKNTTVGGLSGIDYDSDKHTYYLISDDRSAINPARFYTAKIDFSISGIKAVRFTGTFPLKQPVNLVPDPEAIRYNPFGRELVWSSEGERIVGPGDSLLLIDPAISVMSRKGRFIKTFPLPPSLLMHNSAAGPQKNQVLEGLAFDDGYQTLYASMEGPLYEDLTAQKRWIRIYKFDVKSGVNTAQYAYEIEDKYGVTDILSLSNRKFITTERVWLATEHKFLIKAYLTDLSDADNVMDRSTLNTETHFRSAAKKLLLDFSGLPGYIDNIEGATFGPRLPNGHQTIIFVADNNFNKEEQTQFLLFEVK